MIKLKIPRGLQAGFGKEGKIGEQIMRMRKGTAIFSIQLSAACILYTVFALLFTACYLEGSINALRPTGSDTPEDPFNPGSGTDVDPFKVFDVPTLKKVGSGDDGWEMDKDTYYIQTDNIDLSTVDNWEPIHEGQYFYGSFDGQGFTISNLAINRTGPGDNTQGLFGTIGSGGEVKNVNLIAVKIYGNDNTGSVAGINYGSIVNCCSTSNDKITGNDCIGGIAGVNSGYIIKCYSACIVEGVGYIGGIAGNNNGSSGSGRVENCYSTGNVRGTGTYAGGVAGYNNYGNAIVTRCYSTGIVEGGSYVGGVAGENSPSCYIERCVALGPSVSCSGGDIGRVIGNNNYGNSQNNYARSNMQSKDDSEIEDAIDGANVDEADPYGGYLAKSFWENSATVDWDFGDIWEMEPYKLPILQGFPEGTQNPEIIPLP